MNTKYLARFSYNVEEKFSDASGGSYEDYEQVTCYSSFIFDASSHDDARNLALEFSHDRSVSPKILSLVDLLELSDIPKRISLPSTGVDGAGFREIRALEGKEIPVIVGESLIRKALDYEREKHTGQYRADGKTPYSTHPEAVKQILTDAGINNSDNLRGVSGYELFSVALLHDVVEDCGVSVEELRREFNDEIADLVDLLTRKGSRGEYKRKLTSSNSQPAHFVKLADVIHNCESLNVEGVSQSMIERKLKDREFYLGLTKKSVFEGEELATKVSDYLNRRLERALRPYLV